MRFYPFVFTGKERDEETGYGYFGARYMDHELMTMWLSVDPKADKYPGLSPYAYCAWNPLKLVDPDGRELNPVYDNLGNYIGDTKEGFTGFPIVIDERRLQQCLSAENTELGNLSSEVVSAYGRTFDDVASTLSNEAQEKIFTNIVSKLEGTVVGDYTFSMSEIGDKINYYENKDNVPANLGIDVKNLKIFASHKFDFYETTVENLQCSVLNHEWYGHLKMGWGNGNPKGTAKDGGTHYMCYLAVITSPLFSRTTDKYQMFNYNKFNELFK